MAMIGVVQNPSALGVRRDPALAERLRALLGADGEVAVTRTPDDLGPTLDRFLERGCDLVAICGGDGTGTATISRLVERLGPDRLPRLALLRGGTVNTVATNLGVRGRPEEILGRIVADRRAGRPGREASQDLIAVNGMHGFLFAAAMGARFLEAYYGAPVQGVRAATRLALRTAASSLVQGRYARWLFDPVALALTADGAPVALERARLLLCSTIPDVGLGMRVTWQAGREPGRFHLVASGLSTTAMALQLPRVLTGRPLAGSPHVDRLAREVEVRFGAPESWTLDGELFRGDRVAIRIGPRVRIVTGAPAA